MLKPRILFLLFTLVFANILVAQDTITFKQAFVVGAVSQRPYSVVSADPIYYQLITNKQFKPAENDSAGIGRHDSVERWENIKVNQKGVFDSPKLRGGYAYFTYNSPKDEIRILEISGNSDVFVNGIPRGGDVYNKHFTFHPIKLKKGENSFLVKVSRGKVKIQLLPVNKSISFMKRDMTTPDFVTTEDDEKIGSVRILNASVQMQNKLRIVSEANGIIKETKVSSIISLGMRKVPYLVRDSFTQKDTVDVKLKLYNGKDLLDEVTVRYKVRTNDQFYVRTFISDIDGSVQYFAVREGNVEPDIKPAMFLSLHGAAVEARGQSAAYQAKDWGHVICPTNRRDFGFDWEDWGRWDAMEVQQIAEEMYGTDPEHTYLTGHSMGGHGTWQIGATFPGKWAAISPLAGWYSLSSYSRNEKIEATSSVQQMISRSSHSSNTLELSRNYLHHGIYIQHGDSDKVVPVDQARFMREHLSTFHPDYAYYEHSGKKHWFGVDFQSIFDYFKWHCIPQYGDVKVFEFRTASPGVSASSRFVTLYQQEKPFEFCGVKVAQTVPTEMQKRKDIELKTRSIFIETENLVQFKLDLKHCAANDSLNITIDDTIIKKNMAALTDEAWFVKINDTWELTESPTNTFEKNPVRYGNFKDAFRHNMVFVYSTKGTEEENQWSFNKARFDAETFYYRGNGSVDIVADKAFKHGKYKDRSVVLYGNSTTNSAWNVLLNNSPIQVERGTVVIGDKVFKGADLGAYFIYPREDSDVASVAVVTGTGIEGFKAVTPNRYFSSRVSIPDFLIFSSNVYEQGVEGVKAVGYFGNNWTIESGDVVWETGKGL